MPNETLVLALKGLDTSSLLNAAATSRWFWKVGRSDCLWARRLETWRFGAAFVGDQTPCPAARGEQAKAAADFADAQSQVSTGAFVFFLRRSRQDLEVKQLLHKLSFVEERAAAAQALAALGANALDAVMRERSQLDLTAEYHARSVERALLNNWAAHAWQELLVDPHEAFIEEGCLIFSLWALPDKCDPVAVRSQLDDLADSVRKYGSLGSPRKTVETMLSVFEGIQLAASVDMECFERGFCISEALQRRAKTPMSCALLFEAVARRLNLRCALLSCPEWQRGLLRVFTNGNESTNADPPEDDLYVNVFHSQIWTYTQLANFVSNLEGDADFERWIAPSPPKTVFLNIVKGLITVYENALRTMQRLAEDENKLFGLYGQLIALSDPHRSHEMRHARLALALGLPPDPFRLQTAWQDVADLRKSLAESNLSEISTSDVHLHVASRWNHLHAAERQLRSKLSASPRRDESRAKERSAVVRFTVGTVIVHKRYGYLGLIYGWDETCQMPDEWIARMGVDNLQRGTNQPFYNTLVHTEDRPGEQTTYVAEDNIIPLPVEDAVEGARFIIQGYPGQPDLDGQAVRIYPSGGAGRFNCIVEETGERILSSLDFLKPTSGLITHGEIGRYFVAYDRDSGRYVPNEELTRHYPEG